MSNPIVGLTAIATYGDLTEDGLNGVIRIRDADGKQVDTVLYAYSEDSLDAGTSIHSSLTVAGYARTGPIAANSTTFIIPVALMGTAL